MRPATIGAVVLLLAAAWAVRRDLQSEDSSISGIGEAIGAGVESIMVSLSGYSPDKVPEAYRVPIANAESANGIPAGMLARLLWQESRYRPEIISGEKRSPAGAVGIAQFMPATAAEWGIDPRDPFASIAAAGKYLAWLRARLSSWSEALAAYNWGIGNVRRKGLAAAPAETQNYFSQILADIGGDGGIA